MASVTKRTILITGCSEGGAGNALALGFAAKGLRVFATARSLGSMSNLTGKGIETFVLDVTVNDSIVALKDEIEKLTGGKLDILYNNAGAMYEAPAIEADSSRVQKMFDANVFGLFNVVTAFAPFLIAAVPNARSAPTIVNVASVLARIPAPFSSAYNASKAAVAAYSDTLRLELGPFGIRVVTLFMGAVSTRLMDKVEISFKPDSLYTNVEFKFKERTVKHIETAMKTEGFAQQVVPMVLSNGGSGYVWKGGSASLVYLLDSFGPRKVFDSTLKGEAGLSDKALCDQIYKKGQSLTKRS